MPCLNAPQLVTRHPSHDALPVFVFESSTAMNGSTAPSSIAGHGMPCPYCEENAYTAERLYLRTAYQCGAGARRGRACGAASR
jgi:hypothetical protein